MTESVDPAYREARDVLEKLAPARIPREHVVARKASAAPDDGVAAVPSATVGTVPRHWAEETLRRLLEALPDAIVLINREGAIVLVNACAEEMFGYRREELLGH